MVPILRKMSIMENKRIVGCMEFKIVVTVDLSGGLVQQPSEEECM
jgi:hypothetical protein